MNQNKKKKKRLKHGRKQQKQKQKTASSPGQDLHPDSDCIRGTMLYPLSCGELAMKGKRIKRLNVRSTYYKE